MRGNIFKEVEKVVIRVRKAEKEVDIMDKEKISLIKGQKVLLEEIVEYINSYKWLKHQEMKDKIRLFLKSKYDYKLFCSTYGVSYAAAKKSISYANQKLREHIGYTTLTLLEEGRVEEAKALFYFRSGKLQLRSFLLDSAIAIIPPSEYMTISLVDCETELKFLHTYTQAMLEKRVGAIDENKLAYLRYVLEGDNPKLTDGRLKIMRLLSGEVLSIKEFIRELKEEKIF